MSGSVSSVAAGHGEGNSSKDKVVRDGASSSPAAMPTAPAVSAASMNSAHTGAAPSSGNNAILGDFLELQWTEHQNIFTQAIGRLRSKNLFTDATLACDGQFYPVHKFVLATCSEFFAAMFEWTPCVNPVIVLNSISPRDLEAILDFMYGGEASVKECQLEPVMKAAKCLRVRGLTLLEECRPVMHKPSDHLQHIGPAAHAGAGSINVGVNQQQQLLRQRPSPRVGVGLTTTVDTKQGIVMHPVAPLAKKMKPEPMEEEDAVNLPPLPRPRAKSNNKAQISLPSIASLTSAIGDTSIPKNHPAHQIASAARHLSPGSVSHGYQAPPHPATVSGLPSNRASVHPHQQAHHGQPSVSPRYHHQYHHPSSSSGGGITGVIVPSSSSSYSSQHGSSPGHHPSMGGSPHHLPHGSGGGQVAGSSSPHHSPQNVQLSPHSPVGRASSLPTSSGSAGGVPPPQSSNRHLQQLLSTPRGNVVQQRYAGAVPVQQQQMIHPQQYEEMQRKQALLQQQQLQQQQLLRRQHQQQQQQQQQRQSQPMPSRSVHSPTVTSLSLHHSQQYQLQHQQQYQEQQQQLSLHHQHQQQKDMNLSSSATMQTHLKNNQIADDSGGNSSSNTPTGNNNNLATGNNNIISDNLPVGFGSTRDHLASTNPDSSSLPPPPLPPTSSTSSPTATDNTSSNTSANRNSAATVAPSGVAGLGGDGLTPMEQQIINELGASPDDGVTSGAAEGTATEDTDKGDAEQHDAEMLDVLVNDDSLYFHDDADGREDPSMAGGSESQSVKPLSGGAGAAEGRDNSPAEPSAAGDDAATAAGGNTSQGNTTALETSSQKEEEVGEEETSVDNASTPGREASHKAVQKQNSKERRSVRPRSLNRPSNNSNTNSKKRKRKSTSISPPVDAAAGTPDVADATAELPTSNDPQNSDPAVKVDEAELNQDGGMELIGGAMDVDAVELPMSEDEEEELLLALPGGSGISGAGYMLDDVAVSDGELALDDEENIAESSYNSHMDDGASNSSASGRTSSNYSNAPSKVSTRFKCPYCTKVCLKSETLSKHMETHRNKKLTCTVDGCNFETSDAGNLRDHRRTHMSKMCTRCNFSTNRAYSLKKHLANHVGSHRSGDTSTFCTMCDFVNTNPATLKHHMKNHHDHKYTRDTS